MSVSSSLRIATIGVDSAVLDLVEAAERSPVQQLVLAFDADAPPTTLAADDPRLVRVQQIARQTDRGWEILLSDAGVDVVVLGAWAPTRGPVSAEPAAWQERREEQLRRLVQAGIPLVLVPPPCEMLLAYELQMIRSDTRCHLFPYHPLASSVALGELAEVVRSGSTAGIGNVEQLLWERFAPANERTNSGVLAAVTRDALVLRRLLGDVSTVAASGATPDGQQLANLSVHLTGSDGRAARWSIGPVRDEAGAKLTLVGSSESRSLWFADREASSLQAAADFLDSVGEQLALSPREPLQAREPNNTDTSVSHTPTSAPTPVPVQLTWDDICRALEITDAVQRSVKRQRTIELYHEQVTEQETFKGMMAAGGCGMLMWVLLLLMVAGLVEGLQLPIRNLAIWRLWPFFLFAPLVIFLALQLLQFVFREKEKPGA